MREVDLFRPEHQAACRAGGCKQPQLVDEAPESFARFLRALGGYQRTREKLAALVGVEGQAAEEITENLSIQIAPLGNAHLERRAITDVVHLQLEAVDELRIVDELAPLTHHRDATS